MTPEIQRTLSDPAASDWLKASLLAALSRDPVDAANDAESRRQRAHQAEVEAEVDIRVLREKLQRAENGQEQQREAQR